jgi:hypothetical protein
VLVSVATTRVKSKTSHDSDDQISTAQYLEFIQVEQDRLRTLLARHARGLYNTVYSPAGYVLTGSTVTLAKPTDFLALIRFEKLYGTRYYPVWVADGLDTTGMRDGLEFREEATNWIVEPVEDAPGTYRAAYITAPATLTTSPDSTIEIPRECDNVLLERVAAEVRSRCYEDPAPHLAKADQLWSEALPLLKKRYGAHPVQGLRRVRGDS